MNRTLWMLLAAATLVSQTACGVPIRSGSHFARELDPGRNVTFTWNQAADRAVGDPRLEGNQFFEQRLHEAVEWQLALRGIRRVDTNPTLLVHHHLTLADHEYEEEVRDDAGVRQTETYRFEQGTVVVHLVDAASGETVWVGWAQANIEPALAGPDQMRQWVYRVVSEMFKRWPVPER